MEKMNDQYRKDKALPTFRQAGDDIRRARLAVKHAVEAFRESIKIYDLSDVFLQEDIQPAN